MRTASFSPLNIRAILKHYNLLPNKGLGQNFLVDEMVLVDIAKNASIENNDVVLEIGPGLGSLTRHLALAAKQVVAVELDNKLIPILNTILKEFENINIIQGDILKIPVGDLIPQGEFLVVANIPYYITSNLIRHLLESETKPRKIVLTMQKEIAERICSEKKASLLSVSVRVFGKPSILMEIPAEAFYPKPNVDSSVLQVELHESALVAKNKLNTFFQITRAGFSQKRKTLRNSLSAGLSLSADSAAFLLTQAGIDPMRRAETLDMVEWSKLTDSFLERKSDSLKEKTPV